MTEEHDPITCASCGTVNSWMVERCRTCGAELTKKDEQVDLSVDQPVFHGEEAEAIEQPLHEAKQRRWNIEFKRRRLNIFWLVLAGFIYIAVIFVGQWAIARFLVAPDPERAAAFAELSKNPQNLNTFQKETYRSLFSSVIATALALVILTPIIVGGLIGYFSQGIAEAAIGVGLGSVFLVLSEGQVAAAFIGGPMTAGLGALGALTGHLMRRRTKQQQQQ